MYIVHISVLYMYTSDSIKFSIVNIATIYDNFSQKQYPFLLVKIIQIIIPNQAKA